MAPDKPTYVTISFEKGVPTAIDGKKLGAVETIEYLNKLGGENGIGLADLVENRLVGMKSRGVYETPGGTILYKAHKVLETITLDKDTQHYKYLIAEQFADLVYNGKWFTPLRGAVGICHLNAADRYRRGKAEAVQGQRHKRRRHLTLQPLRRRGCDL